MENELLARYLTVIETHSKDFWYYFDNLIDKRFSPWYILIPPGILAGMLSKEERIRRLTLFSSLMVITYLLIISASQTKLAWYDVPLYPYLSILIALIINYIAELAYKLDLPKPKKDLVKYLFLVMVLFVPYQRIFHKTYLPREDPTEKEFYEIGYYLKRAINGEHNLNDSYLLYDGYNLHNLFYIKILNEQGIQVDFKDWTALETTDLVFTHQDNVKQYVKDNYLFEIVEEDGKVSTYLITGLRE
jgi:hypothetical protein